MDAFDQGRFDIVLSTPLLLEYEMVLLRPEQMIVHGFSAYEVATILNTIAARAIPVTQYFDWKPQLRDPDDELVLAAAISGHADVIVTHNLRDFMPAAPSFGIQVLTPGRIIK